MSVPRAVQDIHARIARAEHHLGRLSDEIATHAQNKPYVPVVQDSTYTQLQPIPGSTEFGVSVGVGEVSPIPDHWPMMVGDVLHNLRAALDQIAWQLVISQSTDSPVSQETKGPGDRLTTFPIRSKPPGSRDGNGLPTPPLLYPRTTDAVETLLDALQPYQRSDPATHELAIIKGLNDADKHHSLQVTRAFIGKASTWLTLSNGRIVGSRMSIYQKAVDGDWDLFRLEQDAPLGHIFIGPSEWQLILDADRKVDVDADVAVLITLDERATLAQDARPVTDLLQSLLNFVRRDVLGILEPLL